MEKAHFDVPAMYGDHHVTAVRELLLALPGVDDVYASAGFRQVLVKHDPEVTTSAAIEQALADHGYQVGATEPAFATSPGERVTRHTAAHLGAGDTLSFANAVPWEGRPLWPCPGFDVPPRIAEE